MVALILLVCVSCRPAANTASQPSTSGEVAKVKVTQAGDIYLNGAKSNMDKIKAEFARLKKVNGMVWYYREAPEKPAPAAAESVMKAVIEARLPIKLFDKDFQ
jgi:hypothetical protein